MSPTARCPALAASVLAAGLAVDAGQSSQSAPAPRRICKQLGKALPRHPGDSSFASPRGGAVRYAEVSIECSGETCLPAIASPAAGRKRAWRGRKGPQKKVQLSEYQIM